MLLKSSRIVSIGVLTLCFAYWVGAAQESWTLIETSIFNISESSMRRQGIASDAYGTTFWYSSFHSIIKSSSLTGEANIIQPFAIPMDLRLLLRDDHIGCLDYRDDILYLPVEDSDAYLYPTIVLYDAQNLTYIRHYSLSSEYQPDGLPYIAVDRVNLVAYSSSYSNTTSINFYHLLSFKLISTLKLSQTIDSIQGGKVWKNFLYLTANHDERGFAVYRVDLASGQVIQVIKLPENIREVEGLTFYEEGRGLRAAVLTIRDIDNSLLNKLAIRIAQVLVYCIDIML